MNDDSTFFDINYYTITQNLLNNSTSYKIKITNDGFELIEISTTIMEELIQVILQPIN